MFALGFWKISSPSAQKTMKTRGDVVPALPFFNTTPFWDTEGLYPFSLSTSENLLLCQEKRCSLRCKRSKPTHSPTAAFGMCEHIGRLTSCAQVPKKPVRLILELLSYHLASSKENSDAENWQWVMPFASFRRTMREELTAQWYCQVLWC